MLSSFALALLTLASADPVPSSVRACTAETDRDQRLACFDREIARYPVPKTTHADTAASPSTPAATSTAPMRASAATASEAPSGPKPTAAAAPSTTASPVKPSSSAEARIVSIDHIPNEMVLHLDNGQTWQQTQQAPGDLSLKVGDTVKIEHHLGADWLTGPHVSAMKVRRQTP
jgi:hypothetical protein